MKKLLLVLVGSSIAFTSFAAGMSSSAPTAGKPHASSPAKHHKHHKKNASGQVKAQHKQAASVAH